MKRRFHSTLTQGVKVLRIFWQRIRETKPLFKHLGEASPGFWLVCEESRIESQTVVSLNFLTICLWKFLGCGLKLCKRKSLALHKDQAALAGELF